MYDIVGEPIAALESILTSPEVHSLRLVKDFQGPSGRRGYLYENPATHKQYIGYGTPLTTAHMRR